jgi:hypothetical protein
MEQNNPVADATPTKKLFIHILTKDIPLVRAILDLVDNSVDGAKSMRNESDLHGLFIRIEYDVDHFKIADNCGGIDINTAENYAFRFGKPDSAKMLSHSVGQFGVGMKRAIFKLGRKFTVDSTTHNSHFLIDVDVDNWEKNDKWYFNFSDLDDSKHHKNDQIGTTIAITELEPFIKERFSLGSFTSELVDEIKTAHLISINKGLAISVNRIPLNYQPLQLLQSELLKPAYIQKEYLFLDKTTHKENKVYVKYFAGLADSNPDEAGWYIFCNGRMVLESDQSSQTGWGSNKGFPKYHNQYAMFRGYVFLDSDETSLLPWNTTKTGIDIDSPFFRSILLEMMALGRPVITFLNTLKKAKSQSDEEETVLPEGLVASKLTDYTEIANSPQFEGPTIELPKPVEKMQRIQYEKRKEEVQKVKAQLKVSSNKEVGEKTFEYYYRLEVGNE